MKAMVKSIIPQKYKESSKLMLPVVVMDDVEFCKLCYVGVLIKAQFYIIEICW